MSEEQTPYWHRTIVPGQPSLIPAPGDSEGQVLRKVGLLKEHFRIRRTELVIARLASSDDFVRDTLSSINIWMHKLCEHHDTTGWASLSSRIAELEHARDDAPDPAVRDMLSILIDELASLCVDDGD